MRFWTGDSLHHVWCNRVHYHKTSFLGNLSNFTMFKTRKNFKKMDKINVQKSTCRITFVQKRAALGNLRNFFGGIFVRAYMVREHAHPANTNYRGWGQKGGLSRVHVPFWGILVSGKKLSAVWGLSSAVCRMCMSLFGAFLFSDKMDRRFWDCLRRLCRVCMSRFGAFLFSDKMDRRFWDCLRRGWGACMSLFGAKK